MEGAARRARLLVVGSWTRVLVTASILLAFWLLFAWLALSGRLADLRYLNVPVVHPYPPAGYLQNPFNPSDKGDLINANEAARVKADLLRAGQIELVAAEKGDVSLLKDAVSGRALDRFVALIQQNNAQGIFERAQNSFDSVVAGRLMDPNDPNINWAVKETGTASLLFYSKSTGALVRQEAVRFDNTFWMVSVGDHYLIVDALIRTDPIR